MPSFDFNSAFHAIALVLCLVSYGILGGVVFYQWRIIQDLTNRLMAQDYREYQTVTRPEPAKQKPIEKGNPRVRDDVLGGVY
jgi:hypothetical protein